MPAVSADKDENPKAVLALPEVMASKAVSPTTVFVETEFAPFPIDIELKDPSVVNVGEILLPAIAALAFTSALIFLNYHYLQEFIGKHLMKKIGL